MKVISGLFSCAGKNAVNQDCAVSLHARYMKKRIYIGFVADGLGGYSNGEYASRLVSEKIIKWCNKEFYDISEKYFWNEIKEKLELLIRQMNQSLYEYGTEHSIKLGTTLALIIIYRKKYIVINIGDSRIIFIGKKIEQITNDQKMNSNNLIYKNTIIECLGITESVNPEIKAGKIKERNFNILICTDGFYHQIKEEIMERYLKQKFRSRQEIETVLEKLEKYCEKVGERDNITAILARIKRGING